MIKDKIGLVSGIYKVSASAADVIRHLRKHGT